MTHSSSETRNKFSHRNLLGRCANQCGRRHPRRRRISHRVGAEYQDVTLVHAGGSYAAIKSASRRAGSRQIVI
jgi:hypothetical protein